MNTKMKVLSLALVGLCGYAGSALADCPTSLSPPWTAVSTSGGTAAATAGGLEATPSPCKLSVALDATANSFSLVGVVDGTPNNEATYRFGFYVDATNIGSLDAFSSIQFFSANSANAYPATGGFTNMLRVGAVGTTLFATAATDDATAGNIAVGSTPIPTGAHFVQGQLIVGAAGTGVAKIWIDAADDSATPAITLNVNNQGWVGVDLAALGMLAPQGVAAQSPAGRSVELDAFDSRRTSFIPVPTGP